MVNDSADAQVRRRKDGSRKRRPVIQFPHALFETLEDPPGFAEALALQMRRHGDTPYSIWRALESQAPTSEYALRRWRNGEISPKTVTSVKTLRLIEERYRLPQGYFSAKLANIPGATRHAPIAGISRELQPKLSWHLPDDFPFRPLAQQQEILDWIRRVIVSGGTEYRQFLAGAMKSGYAIRFSKRPSPAPSAPEGGEHVEDIDLQPGTNAPPPALAEEMAELLRFKTATLTPLGFERNGMWCEATATQRTEHLGLLFGALVASPEGKNKGLGVPIARLTFALLIFPSIWDWYLRWRHERRGFYTAWELDMVLIAAALTRITTGWLRQSPRIAERLRPIDGVISEQDITVVATDWNAACDRLHRFAVARARDIKRVARVHRDPFEPILVVLDTPSPVGEYRKIADEILRRMPDERRFPLAAAESVRSFLMIRLGLHLGVRQKNLRELLVCLPGETPTAEKYLIERKRGELRWSDRENGWEVLIPSVAFKNAHSSFFSKKPYRLLLPDLAELYRHIEDYLARHRRTLLRCAADPGTFFVKTIKQPIPDASYDNSTFYYAWRRIIQRFGIYNPYTGRGAIPGLLPHGPHNVRDVLATHVLKVTGSYEQAGYAIQDSPELVAKHYARFLPRDKIAVAAKVLNKVWETA